LCAEEDKFAWIEAVRLLKQAVRAGAVDGDLCGRFRAQRLFQLGLCMFLGSPQVGIATNWIMPIMSIGQVAEILTMAILGVALKRLGWRLTMMLGIFGHVIRFTVFALFPKETWLIILVFCCTASATPSSSRRSIFSSMSIFPRTCGPARRASST
jgi:hypothetical protein